MPSRYDDCFGTEARKGDDDFMPPGLLTPTSAADQNANGSYTRLETPVGGKGAPGRMPSGMAGADGRYNTAAEEGPRS